MAERQKIRKLYERLSMAGFSDRHYQNLMRMLDDASDGDIVDLVTAMDNDEFEDFFRTIVVPISARVVREEMKHFPKNADELALAQVRLARSEESWDLDRFKSTIGRKPKKDTVDGKEVTRPSPIGEITDQDYISLKNAGLSDEDIEKYTSKFRNEERKRTLDEQLKISEKQRKKIDEEIKAKREQLANEIANDMYYEFSPDDGPLKRAAKIVGNTVLGTGVDLFFPETKAEAMQAVIDARDPNYGSVAKDFAFNTALALTPIGVAKGVEKAGIHGIKNAAANFAGNFGLFTAENLARQGLSDHYRVDLPSAAFAAGVGATVPATLSAALYGVNKYIPSARRYTQPALRRAKGLVEGAESSEVEQFEQAADDAFNAITANNKKIPEWKKNIVNIVANRKSQQVAERLTKITGRVYDTDVVMQMLSTKEGLNAVKKMLQAPTPEMIGTASGDMLERYEMAFPGVVNEVLESNTPTSGLARGVDILSRGAEDYGGVIEPIREVNNWGRMPSDSLRHLMDVDPAMVQRWGAHENPTVPDSLGGLYEEWKSKYKKN